MGRCSLVCRMTKVEGEEEQRKFEELLNISGPYKVFEASSFWDGRRKE